MIAGNDSWNVFYTHPGLNFLNLQKCKWNGILRFKKIGALDDNNYVALACLDFSAAFDIVDVGLLLKRLQKWDYRLTLLIINNFNHFMMK